MSNPSAPAIDQGRVRELATRLIEARQLGVGIESLADELVPATTAEANAVDDEVASLSGWPVLGWKIGCTSLHAQQLLGADGPFAGRIYSVLADGAMVANAQLPAEPKLEGEFAFTMAETVEPAAERRDPAALVGSIASVHAAIEVVGGRYAHFIGMPLNALIADAGSNSLLVVGEAHADVAPDDLVTRAATMEVGGTITGQGTGADVLGDPLGVLAWLLGHLGERGITVAAGAIISTGTATQVTDLGPGETATATIDGLGRVSVNRAVE
ncbi:MAG: fumarylacetoacetate hydrolase family protein [Actinomycetota bacterium]